VDVERCTGAGTEVEMHQVVLLTSRMTSLGFQPGPFESQDACMRDLRTKVRSVSRLQAGRFGTAVLQDTLSILFVVLCQVSLAQGDAPAITQLVNTLRRSTGLLDRMLGIDILLKVREEIYTGVAILELVRTMFTQQYRAFHISQSLFEIKFPMTTIECSSPSTSSNATLMVFVKARRILWTNSFIS
jgi:hypothetical protein